MQRPQETKKVEYLKSKIKIVIFDHTSGTVYYLQCYSFWLNQLNRFVSFFINNTFLEFLRVYSF